ncbi:hypothetical protein QQP08_001477 [Theobroma cacao]|nr:hypothetical protein QQP08_001477 [Theobroma cacao]
MCSSTLNINNNINSIGTITVKAFSASEFGGTLNGDASTVSRQRHASISILPSSAPGNNVIFPSNLFPGPLRTAINFPHPKSLPYMLNRGELLVTRVLFVIPPMFHTVAEKDERSSCAVRFNTPLAKKGGRLRQKLYRLKMEVNRDLMKHMNEFDGIIDQLKKVDVKVEEEEKALLFLTLLPNSL